MMSTVVLRALDPECIKLFITQLAKALGEGVLPEMVLITSRPAEESVASWASAFPLNRPQDPALLKARRKALVDRLDELGIPVHEVSFHGLIEDAPGSVRSIANFIGRGLDVAAMAAVPDVSLRHLP